MLQPHFPWLRSQSPGPVLTFIKFHNWEKFPTQIWASKKHMTWLTTLESSGKDGGNSVRNCPVMSAFPCAFLVHYCTASHFGTLSTSAEKGSADSWKVTRCALKSTKFCSHSCRRSSKAVAYHRWILGPRPQGICMQSNNWGFCRKLSFPQSQFCREGFHTLKIKQPTHGPF